MAQNYFECRHPTFNLNEVKSTIRPSLSQENLINFSFFLKFRRFNWVQTPDSASPELIEEDITDIYTDHRERIKNSLSYEKMETALDRVLTCDLPLSEEERHRLIKRALDEVRRTDTTRLCLGQRRCSFKMYLDFEMVIEHNHYFFSEDEINPLRMVPAADSSVQSLKKYEVVPAGNNTERNCCICLEEFSGEGCEALSMPCEHVFHGDCIKKWLSTSHYCPLCRFEMPMAT